MEEIHLQPTTTASTKTTTTTTKTAVITKVLDLSFSSVTFSMSEVDESSFKGFALWNREQFTAYQHQLTMMRKHNAKGGSDLSSLSRNEVTIYRDTKNLFSEAGVCLGKGFISTQHTKLTSSHTRHDFAEAVMFESSSAAGGAAQNPQLQKEDLQK